MKYKSRALKHLNPTIKSEQTMSKHTPGPWEAVYIPYRDAATKDETFCYYIEETGQRGIVAEVEYICTPEWTHANAKLIAAAPDLLEACQNLTKIIGIDSIARNAFIKEWDNAVKAIKKATE